jgi:hypothetical protein
MILGGGNISGKLAVKVARDARIQEWSNYVVLAVAGFPVLLASWRLPAKEASGSEVASSSARS